MGPLPTTASSSAERLSGFNNAGFAVLTIRYRLLSVMGTSIPLTQGDARVAVDMPQSPRPRARGLRTKPLHRHPRAAPDFAIAVGRKDRAGRRETDEMVSEPFSRRPRAEDHADHIPVASHEFSQ